MKRIVLVEDLMISSPSDMARLLENLSTKFKTAQKVRIVAEVIATPKRASRSGKK